MKNILSIGFFSLVLVLAACEMPAGGDSKDSSSSSTSSVTTSSVTSESSSSSEESTTSSSDSSGSSAVSSSDESSTVSSEESTSSSSSPESSESSVSSTSSPSAKRTIDISADNWTFSPSAVTTKKGEVLELRITGVAGTHGFAVPELGINVTIAPGETVTVVIPTDTEGTFSFFCSIPCGSGHRDMTGTITIEA